MMFFKTLSLRVGFGMRLSIKHGLVLIVLKRGLSSFVRGLAPSNIKLAPPWKILFFGTDEFAVMHLKNLNGNRLTSNNKVVKSLDVVIPAAGKCVVGEYARNNGLKCYNWPLPKMLDEYDVGLVVSFGHLIPKRVIDAFPYGILNVHPSILPRWRGASPIVHTILNGDQETGVSIMEIRPIHFDVGPLLMQSRFTVPDNCTTFQLRDYLASEGSNMLLSVLRDLRTWEKQESEQTEEGITYAHKMSSINARVNWEKHTSLEIDRQYRALSEIFGLRSIWNNHKVKLMEKLSLAEMEDGVIQSQLENFPDVQPGFVRFLRTHNIICIRTMDGWAGFRRLTFKKPLTAKMFYNGYLSRPELCVIPFESQENELDKFINANLILNTLKIRQFV